MAFKWLKKNSPENENVNGTSMLQRRPIFSNDGRSSILAWAG